MIRRPHQPERIFIYKINKVLTALILLIAMFPSREIKECRSYEIGRFVYLPGKKIYGFNVVLKTSVPFEPEILAEVLRVFTEKRIQLVHIKVSRPRPEKPVCILLFADSPPRAK
ncbi:MAG: hypothetical protein DRJ47_09630 [Thermoprotei archaeon]|nr:MAG: hypothetical protein DRJ47_09630 [Thermoprotei archaeon]